MYVEELLVVCSRAFLERACLRGLCKKQEKKNVWEIESLHLLHSVISYTK